MVLSLKPAQQSGCCLHWSTQPVITDVTINNFELQTTAFWHYGIHPF